MPELPEVETVVQSLRGIFEKNSIKKISYLRKDLRFPIPQKKINKILLKQEKIRSDRRGKYIVLKTEKGSVLIHLGMSGQMILAQKSEPLAKHTHVILSLSGDMKGDQELRYIDPRRFGLFEATEGPDWSSHVLLCKLGFEPLETKNLGKKLWEASQKKSTSIKNFIMNSHVVVGVGNIYACEALYQSKIHPLALCKDLSLEQYKTLAKKIGVVLRKAIKAGGTTLKDFRSLKNEKGYFQVKLEVYGREGDPCFVCDEPIERFQQNGRSTWVCCSCQPL